MLGFLIYITGFWVLNSVESTYSNSTNSSQFLDRKKQFTPRGYYAGVGFPYIPFAEPLTILAGLAFIAYIIQTYHAVYHHNHGLGGGLLSNVLPTKGKNLPSRPNRYKKQYIV